MLNSEFFQVGLNHYLVLSAAMFSIGMMTVLLRRNLVVMLMGIELMLNAVNISFVAFSHFQGNMQGNVIVFFIMALAASEAAVGLALAVAIFRQFKQVNITEFEQLRG